MRVRNLLFSAAFVAPLFAGPVEAQDANMELARRVLETTPLIDGHNDLPWAIRRFQDAPHDVDAYDLTGRTIGHTDLERLEAGMLGGQFWSVYIPAGWADSGYARVQLEQIDIAHQIINKFPNHFQWALTASDVEAAFAQGRIASMLGIEGGHAIENSLGALRAFYRLGVRYMTLTHSDNIAWAESATDNPETAPHLPEGTGLTAFGEEVVREMNRLGMLVDLSHVSPASMSDALNVSEAPVIFSHSSARGMRDHPRNVPDSILQRLPDNGGVVMVTFVPSFLVDTDERGEATLADAADHIDHIARVAGYDHVGIGGDYDGISTVPVGLEDASTYPYLFAELARRGWSEENLRKLAGENVLRVMREAERVARLMQVERGPSHATIGELDG